MFIPTIIAISAIINSQPVINSSFIESYQNGYFNIGFAKDCYVSQEGGKWWLKFETSSGYRYYLYSFETKEEAEIKLKEIIAHP